MKAEEKAKDGEKRTNQVVEDSKENAAEEREFKVTVRKLKVPVRPRGVLAE